MKPEQDYIGPDPIAWIDRLIEVNGGSAFNGDVKVIIKQTFISLKGEIVKAIEQRKISNV